MTDIIQQLREATSSLHDETEKAMFPDEKEMDRDRYIFFLQCNYLFHLHVENQIHSAAFSNNDEWDNFDRKRIVKLEKDLDDLNAKPEVTMHDVSALTENEWLGVAYVSEGSTLGGQVILKNLRKKPFFDEKHHGRFLQGHGTDTGKAWKSFIKLLKEHGQDKPEEVVKGAIFGFELFKNIAKKQRTAA